MRDELDIKSLRFFSALYRLGNVSPAADSLNISQITLLPHLQTLLREHGAEGITFSVLNIDESTPGDLESGK